MPKHFAQCARTHNARRTQHDDARQIRRGQETTIHAASAKRLIGRGDFHLFAANLVPMPERASSTREERAPVVFSIAKPNDDQRGSDVRASARPAFR